MQFLRDLPIKRKLLLSSLTTCVVALGFAFAILFWFQSFQFRNGFIAELESLGSIIARNSATPLEFGDKVSAAEVLDAVRAKTQIVFAQIHDAEGAPFARYNKPDFIPVLDGPAGRFGLSFVEGMAILTVPIRLDDGRTGRLELHARYADEYNKLLSLYGAVCGMVLSGSLLVILALSSALQRVVAGPIMTLVEVARRVSAEDYSSRAADAGQDEVGQLTRTFNQMLDQIQWRESRLKESQQRYEVAVMGSSDGLWDWDLITDRVYFSPRWKNIIGYEDDQLESRMDVFRTLLHPDDTEYFFAKVADYLEGRTSTYEVEFRFRHKDGSYKWILSRGAALRDKLGKPLRFAGSHTDITERKLAESELRVSREKFETLVNSIDGIVWELDLNTSSLTFVSEQAERLLGYPADQWLKEPNFWRNHIHDADRDKAMIECATAATVRRSSRAEYRMIAADGAEVWIRDIATVTASPNGTRVLRGVLFDITDQKLAEQELEALNRELRDASRAAGMAEIATGVLHNVGNVLNSVNLSASIAVDQLRKSKTSSLAKAVQLLSSHKDDVGTFLSKDPKGRQLPAFLEAVSHQLQKEQTKLTTELQNLQQNIEHIKEIVAMQQSYAKVSGAKEVLSLQELVEDALRMVSSTLVRHEIELVREFEPLAPVLVDRHKVLQILVNFISNAKHALESRAHDRRIILRIAARGDSSVCVEVQDNGIGIARENLTRIFQHGFTTKKTGHGFGLHSGANAAKELGGNLIARSDGPGLGATFCLELPVTEKSSATIRSSSHVLYAPVLGSTAA